MTINENALFDLINSEEDEYHDFKEQWYSPYDKAELIKDIFSFVNTTHHKDCYLLIGIDDHHKVVGIENDKNRLNTQQLTDFLHSLPIANAHTPKVIVKSIQIDDHTIDVIVIKETTDVPVYLVEDKQPKHSKRPIHAGQIFARDNDTNTSIRESANIGLAERLWKKRFGEDLSIKDQYKVKLSDYHHWEYFELDNIGFRYIMDPDFCMYLEDDNESRYRAESYTLGQVRLDMSWHKLLLKYRNSTIDEFLVVFMDGARFLTVVPNLGSINSMASDMLTFQYYLADSLEYAVEKLILNMKKSAITPDYGQKVQLLSHIVIFNDYDQLKQVTSNLNQQYNFIKEKCKPTNDQIQLCRGTLSMDFKKSDTEMTKWHIELMCEEANVSKYINQYLNTGEL